MSRADQWRERAATRIKGVVYSSSAIVRAKQVSLSEANRAAEPAIAINADTFDRQYRGAGQAAQHQVFTVRVEIAVEVEMRFSIRGSTGERIKGSYLIKSHSNMLQVSNTLRGQCIQTVQTGSALFSAAAGKWRRGDRNSDLSTP